MRKKNPKVSVLVPAYNHQAYICEAIDSVLKQTLEEWELIIIDDDSHDDTFVYANDCVKQCNDARIKILKNNQNCGAPATLNRALGLAKGEHVAILNSDDVYDDQRLAYLYEKMKKSQYALMGTSVALMNQSGGIVEDSQHWWQLWYQDLVSYYLQSDDMVAALLRGNFFITTSNFYMDKNAVSAVGGFSEYRYVHDYDYVFRLLAQDPLSVCFDAECTLLKYRLHDANTIRENPLAANQETFRLLSQWAPKLIDTMQLSEHKQSVSDCGRAWNNAWQHLSKIEAHIEQAYEKRWHILTTSEDYRLGKYAGKRLRAIRRLLSFKSPFNSDNE